MMIDHDCGDYAYEGKIGLVRFTLLMLRSGVSPVTHVEDNLVPLALLDNKLKIVKQTFTYVMVNY